MKLSTAATVLFTGLIALAGCSTGKVDTVMEWPVVNDALTKGRSAYRLAQQHDARGEKDQACRQIRETLNQLARGRIRYTDAFGGSRHKIYDMIDRNNCKLSYQHG